MTTPSKGIRIVGDDRARLLLHADVSAGPSECWPWLGGINRHGYGRSYLRGRTVEAHRAIYVVFVGDIPVNRQIDHLCRNRRCVNPTHLELVDHAENVRRGVAARRAAAA